MVILLCSLIPLVLLLFLILILRPRLLARVLILFLPLLFRFSLLPLILLVPILLPLQLRIVLRLLVAVVLRFLSCSSWAVVAGPMIVVLRSVAFLSGRLGVVVVVVAVMSVVGWIHPEDSQALLPCGR